MIHVHDVDNADILFERLMKETNCLDNLAAVIAKRKAKLMVRFEANAFGCNLKLLSYLDGESGASAACIPGEPTGAAAQHAEEKTPNLQDLSVPCEPGNGRTKPLAAASAIPNQGPQFAVAVQPRGKPPGPNRPVVGYSRIPLVPSTIGGNQHEAISKLYEQLQTCQDGSHQSDMILDVLRVLEGKDTVTDVERLDDAVVPSLQPNPGGSVTNVNSSLQTQSITATSSSQVKPPRVAAGVQVSTTSGTTARVHRPLVCNPCGKLLYLCVCHQQRDTSQGDDEARIVFPQLPTIGRGAGTKTPSVSLAPSTIGDVDRLSILAGRLHDGDIDSDTYNRLVGSLVYERTRREDIAGAKEANGAGAKTPSVPLAPSTMGNVERLSILAGRLHKGDIDTPEYNRLFGRLVYDGMREEDIATRAKEANACMVEPDDPIDQPWVHPSRTVASRDAPVSKWKEPQQRRRMAKQNGPGVRHQEKTAKRCAPRTTREKKVGISSANVPISTSTVSPVQADAGVWTGNRRVLAAQGLQQIHHRQNAPVLEQPESPCIESPEHHNVVLLGFDEEGDVSSDSDVSSSDRGGLYDPRLSVVKPIDTISVSHQVLRRKKKLVVDSVSSKFHSKSNLDDEGSDLSRGEILLDCDTDGAIAATPDRPHRGENRSTERLTHLLDYATEGDVSSDSDISLSEKGGLYDPRLLFVKPIDSIPVSPQELRHEKNLVADSASSSDVVFSDSRSKRKTATPLRKKDRKRSTKRRKDNAAASAGGLTGAKAAPANAPPSALLSVKLENNPVKSATLKASKTVKAERKAAETAKAAKPAKADKAAKSALDKKSKRRVERAYIDVEASEASDENSTSEPTEAPETSEESDTFSDASETRVLGQENEATETKEATKAREAPDWTNTGVSDEGGSDTPRLYNPERILRKEKHIVDGVEHWKYLVKWQGVFTYMGWLHRGEGGRVTVMLAWALKL